MLENKKENDYGGMPSYEDEDEDYEGEEGSGDDLKVDSMGNTIEQEDEEEELEDVS